MRTSDIRHGLAIRALLLLVGLTSAIPAADNRRISFTLKFTLAAEDDTEDVRFTCLVPKTVPGRQTVDSIRFSPPPQKQFDEQGGMYVQYAVPKPDRKTDIAITVDMAIHKFDLSVAQARPELRRMENGSADVFKPYLGREKYLESDDLGVVALAARATGETELDKVKALLASVTDELKQSHYRPEDRGAVETLKSKDGDCTDYADLLIALCRARGIPARTSEGYLTTTVARDDTQKHDWVEIYLKDLGWVPFDPFHIDLNAAKVDTLRPVYILLSNRRNDDTLGQFHYWYLTSGKGKVSGSDQFFIHWQREE